MSNPQNIDPKTGLPEIPSGWYWRVEHSEDLFGRVIGYDEPAVRVTLIQHVPKWYRKNRFIRHESVTRRLRVYEPLDPATKRTRPEAYPQMIRLAAAQVMENRKKSSIAEVKNNKANDVIKKYVGTYPPKELN